MMNCPLKGEKRREKFEMKDGQLIEKLLLSQRKQRSKEGYRKKVKLTFNPQTKLTRHQRWINTPLENIQKSHHGRGANYFKASFELIVQSAYSPRKTPLPSGSHRSRTCLNRHYVIRQIPSFNDECEV